MKIPRAVYAIRNEKTGRIYVGSTSNLANRILEHFYDLRNGKHPIEQMQKDYDEGGTEFTVFALDKIHCLDDLNKEYLWMDILGTRDQAHGYNTRDPSSVNCLPGKGLFVNVKTADFVFTRALIDLFDPENRKMRKGPQYNRRPYRRTERRERNGAGVHDR